MYRNYAWLPAAAFMAFLAVACSDTVTTPNPLATDAPLAMEAASVETIVWTGHGSDNLPCTGGYHWILAGHHGGTAVPVFFSEIGGVPQAGADMSRPSGDNNPTTNAAWHYDSGLIDLEEGVTPYVYYEGADLSKAVLTISNCLEDDNGELEGEIAVVKTANTSYDLRHHWDIAKKVETENEYELEDGTPKIWLYIDGSGNETATWTVDVTYLGAVAENIKVWGDISVIVPIQSDFSAQIDDVTDVLLGEEVDVVCNFEPFGVLDFPVVLDPGQTLECSYEATLDELEDGKNVATATGEFLDPVATPISEPGEADVIFGAPANEFDDVVDIQDLSSLLGLQILGQLDAADLAEGEVTSFPYDHLFAYGAEGFGQEQCDLGVRVTNTAVIVQTGQEADAELAINIQCYEFDSAWAMGSGGDVVVHEFCDNAVQNFSNWGWSNFIIQDYGPQDWTLYAGAAQCDASKGWEAGIFRVEYTVLEGFKYVFIPAAGVIFEGEAVYAGLEMFPKTPRGAYTVAPGQYSIASPLGAEIFVIAHVNAGQPDPNFGPPQPE